MGNPHEHSRNWLATFLIFRFISRLSIAVTIVQGFLYFCGLCSFQQYRWTILKRICRNRLRLVCKVERMKVKCIHALTLIRRMAVFVGLMRLLVLVLAYLLFLFLLSRAVQVWDVWWSCCFAVLLVFGVMWLAPLGPLYFFSFFKNKLLISLSKKVSV
jgi:CBS domain containing-hemolysin-like protein